MHSFPTSTVNLTYASPRKQKSTIPIAASISQAFLGRKEALFTEKNGVEDEARQLLQAACSSDRSIHFSLSRCSVPAVLANRLESLQWHAKAIQCHSEAVQISDFFRLRGHTQTKQTKTEFEDSKEPRGRVTLWRAAIGTIQYFLCSTTSAGERAVARTWHASDFSRRARRHWMCADSSAGIATRG